MVRVEYLVAVHHCHEVFCLTQVNDVVRIPWQHVDAQDVVTAYLLLPSFA